MAGPIRISILANGRQARAEANRTAGVFTGLGRSIARLGVGGGLVGLTYAAGRFAKASVDLEAKYSTTMRTIQAATGASGRAMEQLNDLAIKLGADTAFSANDAASAMLELSKAGITTRNIMRGGVAGTLQLAAAGGTELGTAATIASNAMNAFNLAGRDMDRIAAALAGGANASTASVESLGQALSQVGPGAVNAGLSLNETVAALSAFDSAGIKGSDAGTSLKTMLARLVPQTTKASDAMKELGLDFVKGNGEFESLVDIAGQLNDKLGKLAPAQRQVALNTIFGSDASRAATVLMRQGEAGIRKFIKATNDQNAAQEMAAARMGGTAGSLERLSGAVETAQLRLGQELAPTIQRVADGLADNAVPAMESAIDGAKVFADAVEPLAKGLKELAGIGVDAVKFLDDLPAPVKEIGIQAGIAALVLPRLTAGVTATTAAISANIVRLQQWRAEMTYAVTRAQQVSAMMSRMGAAARAAAGVGGMVALTQASQQTSRELGALQGAAGGALLGFSLGGPLGGAIGAGAGAMWGLTNATNASREAFRQSIKFQEDYRASLDQTTAAVTKQTRATIYQNLQNSEALTVSRALGIADRDLVGFIEGREGAIRRVTSAVRENTASARQLRGANSDAFYFNRQSAGDFLNSLRLGGKALTEERRELLRQIEATKTWGGALKGLPKRVRVELRNQNYRPTLQQVRALGRQYDLTPKQVRTIVRLTGAENAQRQARRTKDELEGVGRAKGDVTRWQRDLGSGVTSGRRKAEQGSAGILRELEKIDRARANMSPFTASLRTGVAGAQSVATTGGQQVGANLKAGVIAGFAGTAGVLAAQAASAVRQAVAAARAAGKIKSPSQVMRDQVGVPLAQGITVGFIRGARQGSNEISRQLDKVFQLIDKKLDGKKFAGRRKALLKSLRDERAALVANGKAQEKVNRQLEKAEQRYKSLRNTADQFAKSIKSGFQTYGSVVGLGTTGDSSIVTLPALLSQLTARAGIAEQFNEVIASLRGKLNRTSLRQLLDQAASGDLESALATAQAIASGEQGTIRQINQLTAQIAEAGEKLGAKMRREFYGHGLDLAEGTVKGLEKRQRRLDQIAERLAKAFLREAGLYAPGGSQDKSSDRPSTRARTSATERFMQSDAPAVATTVNLRLTSEQVSQLQRGREIQADLDVYHGAGGRSKVRKP